VADSLSTACDVQRDAAAVGFDWPDVGGAAEKLDEEVGELREALAQNARARAVAELGDVLFSAVNVARFLGIAPDDALQQATARFQRRFAHTRERIEQSGKRMEACSLEELDAAWNCVKREIDSSDRSGAEAQ